MQSPRVKRRYRAYFKKEAGNRADVMLGDGSIIVQSV
jgi:hypothetical protein